MILRMFVIAALVACQHDPGAPAAPIATPAPRDAAPSIDAADEAAAIKDIDPIGYAVRVAFGGKLPVLPLVSSDGKHVAIDLGYGRGMGYWRTYAYGWYGVGGKLEDKVVLVDEAAVNAGTAPDAAKLAAAATTVKDKLAGYVSFPLQPSVTMGASPDGKADVGSAALGATKLDVIQGVAAGATVTWTDAKGKTLTKFTVAPRPRVTVKPGVEKCGGDPELTGVWFDEPHMRLVVSIRFPGHDSCEDEPMDWHVY